MSTPIEAYGFGWLKRAFTYFEKFAKRYATLEERVTALEEALKKQPADACEFCGERAMRKTEAGPLMGNQGTQWHIDFRAGCGNLHRPISGVSA